MKFNKEWQLKNKMSENSTEAERIKWHLAHEKNCSCRPTPVKLKEKLLKKNLGANKNSIHFVFAY